MDSIQIAIQRMDSHPIKVKGTHDELAAFLWEIVQRVDHDDPIVVQLVKGDLIIRYLKDWSKGD
jgi:hypothetical protein